MQTGGLAVNADVCHTPAGTDQIRGELEGLRHTNRLESNVGAEAVGQRHDLSDGILASVVDRGVRAEPPCAVQSAVGEVDRHDPPGV